MKKLKSIITGLSACMMISSMPISVSSNDEIMNDMNYVCSDLSITNDAGITFSVDDGGYYDNAVLVSEEINDSVSKYETVRTYRMPDGTISTDSLSVDKNTNNSNSIAPYSSSKGQINNAVFTKTTGMAQVTIIASFDWYEEGAWSYVRCSNMTAYHVVDSNQVSCSKFEKSKSNGYIKAGKAWANVDYYFYNTKVPATRDSGSFKVTCSDTGSTST